MPEILEVDDLSFEVRRSDRRKTIALIVDRGGQLVIAAPMNCDASLMRSVVQSKKQWIYTQLLDKEKNLTLIPPLKEYVSGEGFFYLGRSYRLQIVPPDPNQARTPILQFFRGQFVLRADERFNGRKHFMAWYTKQCRTWLQRQLPSFAQRLDVKLPPLTVADLGYRWGSCSASQVNFHWRVVMLPLPVLEYVVIHELAHIVFPNHSEQFWQTIERIIPEWRDRKRWLAENGVLYSL